MSTLPTPPEMFGSATITRSAAGSYSAGRWVAGGTSAITITASIQQYRPRPDELQHLSEGDRAREAVRIYTSTQLKTANETDGTLADFLTRNGEQWEVVSVESWGHGIQHYKAIALRVARQ